jgi:nuclear pore complex protein Nup107
MLKWMNRLWVSAIEMVQHASSYAKGMPAMQTSRFLASHRLPETGIVGQFAQALDSYQPSTPLGTSDYETALDLVQTFQLSVEDKLKNLRGPGLHKNVQDLRGIDEQEVDYWLLEAQTWGLVSVVINNDKAKAKCGSNVERVEDLDTITPYSSEQQIWKRFLLDDGLANERQNVISWLQRSSRESGEDIDSIVQALEDGADRGQGLWAAGWLFTKEEIKGHKRLHPGSRVLQPTDSRLTGAFHKTENDRGLIIQLDPDAPSRQLRDLREEDKYFERAVWRACYEMMRRGMSWKEVRKWCEDRDEGWRAVSMRGPYPPDNDDDDDTDEGFEEQSDYESDILQDTGNSDSYIANNRSRPLWRRMCFALAKNGGLDDYERAIYGILSGDLDTVKKVSRTWDDHLFAHYNSLLKSQFEHYLQKKYPERVPVAMSDRFGLFDSVAFHGDPDGVVARLIDTIAENDDTKEEAQSSLKAIQGSLISGRLEELVRAQGYFISKSSNVDGTSRLIPLTPHGYSNPSAPNFDLELLGSADALRVVVHVLIIFKRYLNFSFGTGEDFNQMENVLVAYIEFLCATDNFELVPLYASHLSKDRTIKTLGQVLTTVTEVRKQVKLLKLMQGLNMDYRKIITGHFKILMSEHQKLKFPEVTFQVLVSPSKGIEPGQDIVLNFMDATVDELDETLIRGLEWFMHVDGMWQETVEATGQLYKQFFCKCIYE